jgi:hypothetical protein
LLNAAADGAEINGFAWRSENSAEAPPTSGHCLVGALAVKKGHIQDLKL